MDLQIIRTRHPPEAYLEQLLILLRHESPNVTLEELKHRLDDLPEDDRFFLALDAELLIGYAHFTMERSLSQEDSVELVDIIVAPELRRQGVGRTLMTAAETWAFQSERARLSLKANVVRSDVLAFLAALGYEPSSTYQEYARDLAATRRAEAPTQPQEE